MKFLRLSILLAATSLLFNSCVKSTYDSAPDSSEVNPGLTPSCSIKALFDEALTFNYSIGQMRVLGDSIISGIVVADDKSGNFYKQIIIEDSLAGIIIALDKNGVYADYPIGRRVFIKTKGLILYNYNGVPEIVFAVTSNGGSYSTTGIPSTLVGDHVIKGNYPNTVTPIPVSVLDLVGSGSTYLNRLVKISNMQFTDNSRGVPYAASTASGSFSTKRYVTDCPDHNVTAWTMYNSAFANFQPYMTPNGQGDLVVIYSTYRSEIQLLIRDTTDVRFTNTRCN